MFITRRLVSTISSGLRSYSSAPRKRFYKQVSVTQNNGSYEINLDTRRLKTPKGNPLLIPSQPLALAIASEWQGQKKLLKQSEMHLTSLTFTCIDNPMKLTTESMASQLINFLETDTVCYRSEEPEELRKREDRIWNPVVNWFTQKYDVEVEVISNLLQTPVPYETLEVIRGHLLRLNFESLVGFNYICENLKSVILTFALIERQIDVEQAVSMSLLEVDFQTQTWGNIEWAHDMDMVQLRSRVAAGAFFTLCHKDSVIEQSKIIKETRH